LNDLSQTAEDTKNAEGAESKYLKAKIFFQTGKFEDCEKEIMDFISKNTPHQYWLAQSFILLSDIYLKKNDLFQARHTLKSIVDNYANKEDGIIETSLQKIRQIEEMEKESILDNKESIDSVNNQ